jgi:predicted nucleotidyltransferase
MNLQVRISIPYLWGDQTFQKNEWGFLNFLVGPNGTGKTLFAEQLKQQCQNQGMKPRYLNAERLAGLEKQSYGNFGSSGLSNGLNIGTFPEYKRQGMNFGLSADAFVTLKEKLDVRIRIEASLSQLFGRRVRLAEEGGFLKPKVQKIQGGDEYGLKENESHGLKEIITLLTFLYNDEHNCLIIDEPELHLHPQFQTLFLQEMRQIAGDPRTDPDKKCFFLITHSPYYVDIRTLEDLRHCIVFHPDKLPTYVDQLDGEDEWRVKHLLPRLNTHHKQFFFASRPIFVEGYTDQQLFTLVQEKRGKLLGAAGACIIDVGGKDELDLFFRLCKKLNIDAQFISDLDTLVQGKLRQSVSQDNRCKDYLQREGSGIDLMIPLGEVEQAIDDCSKEIESAHVTMTAPDPSMQLLFDALAAVKGIEKKRYVFFLLRHSFGHKLKT